MVYVWRGVKFSIPEMERSDRESFPIKTYRQTGASFKGWTTSTTISRRAKGKGRACKLQFTKTGGPCKIRELAEMLFVPSKDHKVAKGSWNSFIWHFGVWYKEAGIGHKLCSRAKSSSSNYWRKSGKANDQKRPEKSTIRMSPCYSKNPLRAKARSCRLSCHHWITFIRRCH